MLIIRAINNAVAISLPVLASVLAFVVYALSGHSLDPANIFASLTLFTLLRMPLMLLRKPPALAVSILGHSRNFLALSLSSIADAQNAIKRLYAVFEAETQTEDNQVDHDLEDAVVIENGEFTWDSPPPQSEKTKKKSSKRVAVVPAAPGAEPQKVFSMKDVNMTIPMGQLTAIVGKSGFSGLEYVVYIDYVFTGPVGMGKTSLLEAMIGEMRKLSGTVK